MNVKGLPIELASAQHPLIQLAFSPEASIRFGRLGELLRAVLDPRGAVEERRSKAILVLESVAELNLDNESLLSFENEWLVATAVDPGGTALLEMQADAQLRRGGLVMSPSNWFHETMGKLVLTVPAIEVADAARAEERLPMSTKAEALHAWRSGAQLALKDYMSGELDRWTEAECVAGIRCLVLSIVHGSGKLDSSSARFESEGIGLWDALHKQMGGRSPHYPSYSHSEAQRKLLLFLRGKAAAGKLLAPEPGIGLQTSHANGVKILLGPIPPSADHRDADLLREFEPLVSSSVPARGMPSRRDAAIMFETLHREFPWARRAIEQVQRQLQTAQRFGAKGIRLSPLLLVGPPGTGKSRLARRMANELHLPYVPISCAGAEDAKSLSGTSRGWASGEPSPILRTMLRHRSASAFILLDEVDKVARSGRNAPALTSLLLGLLEPETAKRWRDSFLQTECDLSHLVFCATSNSLDGISRPLLSRFEVVYVPEPGCEHVPALIAGITHDLELEWGLEKDTLPLAPHHQIEGGLANARDIRRHVLAFLSVWSEQNLEPGRLH